MSVTTVARIEGYNRLGIKRETKHTNGGRDGTYRKRRGISMTLTDGASVFVTLEDLGDALRVLKITPAELGYKTVGRAPKNDAPVGRRKGSPS